MRRSLLPLLLVAAAAACDGGDAPEVPEEVRAARHDARRLACLGAELARTAEEEARALEEMTAAAPGVGNAALGFTRAYLQHAQLRHAAYAQADSALNHARTPADSSRHAAQADRYSISVPEPGTVEANVIANYENELAALLADEDHPCNWDLEEEPARR